SALTSSTFANTDRWCLTSPDKLWAPYDKVEGTDIDLTDPRANAVIITDLTDTILFKKRATPRMDPPAKPRFLTPVSTCTENGLFVQGQYFAIFTPDADFEASLREQAAQYSLMRTETTSHDHDEYGRYTDVETKYFPLTTCRGLTAPYSTYYGYNVDFIVQDGKFVGVVFCRFFRGKSDAYGEEIISLPNSPEDRGEHLIILYADERIVGETMTNYADHSGRDFTDTSITFKLSATTDGKTVQNAHWD
ncbi:MAG: hypothetical protein J6R42_00335, partial [Clostridia bacterium]|nr:hypothetical protein [Clostridia bacterium]